jgi:hypothetical protein
MRDWLTLERLDVVSGECGRPANAGVDARRLLILMRAFELNGLRDCHCFRERVDDTRTDERAYRFLALTRPAVAS